MSSNEHSAGLDFDAVVSEFRSEQRLAGFDQFEARDGTVLKYRCYPSNSRTALILLHGSGTDSKYLATFAHGLAEAGVAIVYTPDIRGQGSCPVRRGDIDYIEQLEDDLAELIEAFFADRFEPTVRLNIPHAEIGTVEGASHLGLVLNKETLGIACQWIQKLALREGSHAAGF